MSTRLHGWRKLAGSTWGSPNDPQFFGDLDIDAAAMLETVETLREAGSAHVTITHLVGRAVAHALVEVPEMTVRLARGREHPRDSVDVFFIVSTDGGSDLSGIKVAQADRKGIGEIAEELAAGRRSLSDGTDASFGRAKKMLSILPPRVLHQALRMSAWLTSDLDLDLPRLGMRRESFGSAMVTSVGMWGVVRAYSPLASYYRVPVLVCVGAVTQRPVAIQGRVVVRPIVTITATFDHRYVDGAQAARFAHAIHEYCAHPTLFEPETRVDATVITRA